MREIRTLRATWRGLETWCGSGPPGHNDAPALDPTYGSRGRATASGDPVGDEKFSSLPRPSRHVRFFAVVGTKRTFSQRNMSGCDL
jgi:hypothetical protein